MAGKPVTGLPDLTADKRACCLTLQHDVWSPRDMEETLADMRESKVKWSMRPFSWADCTQGQWWSVIAGWTSGTRLITPHINVAYMAKSLRTFLALDLVCPLYISCKIVLANYLYLGLVVDHDK